MNETLGLVAKLIATFILHFNRIWEREFKIDAPGMLTACIHKTTISNQCWVIVILTQEIFPKEKGN